MIMVLTNTGDLAADLLVLTMLRREIPFVRVNDDLFPSDVQITWNPRSCSLWVREREIPLESVAAIWCRGLFRSAHGTAATDSGVNRFVARESFASLFGAMESSVAAWMNKPSATLLAENKLLQLRSAAEIGFDVPATLVSNRPSTVRSMVRQAHAVVKPLSGTRVETGDGTSLIYTQTIDDLDGARDAEVAACPAIYQSRVEKAYDLRITVVGRRIFAVRIFTPNEPVDWRAHDDVQVRYEACTVPESVAKKCCALLDRFGLRYGAIDMIVDRCGDWFFLELNPAGQWGWIERATGQAITDAIVDELQCA